MFFTSQFQGPECKGLFENLPEHDNANGDQMPIAASSMIRSHSVSGDLHGVQPDPIAADILRKEPEQETFARLKISPTGIYCLSSVLDVCCCFDLPFFINMEWCICKEFYLILLHVFLNIASAILLHIIQAIILYVVR